MIVLSRARRLRKDFWRWIHVHIELPMFRRWGKRHLAQRFLDHILNARRRYFRAIISEGRAKKDESDAP